MSTEKHDQITAATEGCAAAAGYADRAKKCVDEAMQFAGVMRRRSHRRKDYATAEMWEHLRSTLYGAQYALGKMQRHTKVISNSHEN